MDSKYKQEVYMHGKKDAIIALCAYLVVAVLGIVFWFIVTNVELTGFLDLLVSFALPVIVTGMVFAIVHAKKQSLASIGFHKESMWPALRFGLLIVLIFSTFGVVPGLVYGWEFNSIGAIIPLLFTVFILAAFEDIFFVGYIQTRLYGLFKKDALAILVGAVLFAIIHIPVGLLGDIGADLISALIGWAVMHLIFVLIFRRNFSLIPVFIAHTLSNFFRRGGLWVEFNPYYNGLWMYTAEYLVLLLLVILGIVNWLRFKRRRTT